MLAALGVRTRRAIRSGADPRSGRKAQSENPGCRGTNTVRPRYLGWIPKPSDVGWAVAAILSLRSVLSTRDTKASDAPEATTSRTFTLGAYGHCRTCPCRRESGQLGSRHRSGARLVWSRRN